MGLSDFNINNNKITYFEGSDIDLKTNRSYYSSAIYYVYFPETGNLWSVRSRSTPAFIRKINNYKDFFFGTMNTR